ncbi:MULTISPECIES: hypothetical protein [unclassified Achromobacter]|uniref:hypothetical protein n=1 Tax=unclassified Achromobacter TaxID=2626865 RepID=UPI000B518979|nr:MULTISPECIES: hypothetical protein [unclassified Achromobacter]OWT69227.1 hypothetical protein CEY05_28815 [Achromobacter sp. HZ34]OWT70632.1 hypothetical protein CEY04_27645 [Achromobacter sp. HZ28]
MQVTEAQPPTIGGLVVNEMRLMYGAKFAQQWQGLTPRELRESWDEKLAGLNESEVRTALVACLSRDWPPTVPEFLRLCRPWMNAEVAYHDAVAGMAARRRGEMGLWPHPAVYWAAVATGTHDLLGSTYGAIKGRWERAFSDELAKGYWADVPPVREALPAPGQTQATKEEAEAALKKMGAVDVLTAKPQGTAWANKILAEHDRKGGKRYSLTVVAMAKRALGMELNAGEAA